MNICLFTRPHREVKPLIKRGDNYFEMLEKGIQKRLKIYRRDQWHIMHYFPELPSVLNWPNGCHPWAREPIITKQDQCTELKKSFSPCSQNTRKMVLLGIAHSSFVRYLRDANAELNIEISTDPEGFTFLDTLQSGK